MHSFSGNRKVYMLVWFVVYLKNGYVSVWELVYEMIFSFILDEALTQEILGPFLLL